MRVVKDGQVVEDTWQLIDDEADIPSGDIIISWQRWEQAREALIASDGRLGVCISGADDLDAVVPDLPHFALIALDFPAFADGRNYSNARLLKERYDFSGELRAVGNVLRDQLFYMARCGIDSFAIEADKNAEDALIGLQDFSLVYQFAGDDQIPAYRRR